MRQAMGAAAALLIATSAAAKEPEKGEEQKAGAGMMEETGTDPAGTEGLETGAYSPKGKTGKLKKDDDDDRDADAAAAKRRLEGLTLFGQVTIGFAEEPPITAAGLAERDATSYTVMIGGTYFFSKTFGAGLRAPWTTASLGQPAYSQASQTDSLGTQAFGSPELSATYRVEMGKRSDLPLTLALGVPIAQGATDPGSVETPKVEQARVNRTADGAHGWRHGELFTPGYMPITLSGALRHFGSRFEAQAFLKANLMPKVRGEIGSPDVIPGGRIEQKGMMMRTIVGGGAQYEVLKDKASAGLDAWLTYDFARTVEFTSSGGGSDLSRAQFVLEPRLGAKFGKIRPYLAFLVPVGGDLPMNALRVGAEGDLDF